MNHAPELTLRHRYNVRSYEPRVDRRISIASICNHLQDIASRHADALGFGLKDLEQTGHFWVLARLHVMMDRMPGFGEHTEVQTWPSANERVVALRDFLIHDDNALIGKATTSWVTVNAQTHRPDKPDAVLDRRLIPERDRATTFPSKAIKRLKHGEHTAAITARRSDMDINNHVNNVKYVEFCLEAVPEAWTSENRCMGIDIQFRNESFAGDEYLASCSQDGQDSDFDTCLHNLIRTSDNKEIVRMRSWWKKS